ncbi:hypothetical protein DFH09DRAFT_1073358 [Mycena vulgaris]|nr:hypothetical protein DFH09DRAFT_1073358 [Mycena vulgaris]
MAKVSSRTVGIVVLRGDTKRSSWVCFAVMESVTNSGVLNRDTRPLSISSRLKTMSKWQQFLHPRRCARHGLPSRPIGPELRLYFVDTQYLKEFEGVAAVPAEIYAPKMNGNHVEEAAWNIHDGSRRIIEKDVVAAKSKIAQLQKGAGLQK